MNRSRTVGPSSRAVKKKATDEKRVEFVVWKKYSQERRDLGILEKYSRGQGLGF
jgi:hypothetical protein